MALLSDQAKEYLAAKKLANFKELNQVEIGDLPKCIAIKVRQKRPGEMHRQKRSEFIEGYARYLLFKSKKYAGLTEACRRYQKMGAKGRPHRHTGLLRCILGCKPGGSRDKQRRNVSQHRLAFEALVRDNCSPEKLANRKFQISELLEPNRSRNSNAVKVQDLGLKITPGEFGLCLYKGTSKGRVKIIMPPLPIGVKSDALDAFAFIKKHLQKSLKPTNATPSPKDEDDDW
jgi:hypothetical protein